MNASQSTLTRLIDSLNPLILFEALTQELRSEQERQPGIHSGFVRDVPLLTRCIGPDWSADSGGESTPIMTRHYMASFVLRHSASWVALALEWIARRQPWLHLPPHEKSPYAPLHFELKTLALRSAHTAFRAPLDSPAPYPHLGFSARGLEWHLRPRTLCSHFDPYSPVPCREPSVSPGSPCTRHSNPDFYASEKPSESLGLAAPYGQMRLALRHSAARRDTMLAFYANFANLGTYNEEQLESLVESFWQRFQKKSTGFAQGGMAPLEAALLLGYESLTGAESADPSELKSRFRSLAKKLHPDCGGRSEDFIDLKRAYAALEHHLEHSCRSA